MGWAGPSKRSHPGPGECKAVEGREQGGKWASELGELDPVRKARGNCVSPAASPVMGAQRIQDELNPILLPQLLSVLPDYARHVLDVA